MAPRNPAHAASPSPGDLASGRDEAGLGRRRRLVEVVLPSCERTGDLKYSGMAKSRGLIPALGSRLATTWPVTSSNSRFTPSRRKAAGGLHPHWVGERAAHVGAVDARDEHPGGPGLPATEPTPTAVVVEREVSVRQPQERLRDDALAGDLPEAHEVRRRNALLRSNCRGTARGGEGTNPGRRAGRTRSPELGRRQRRRSARADPPPPSPPTRPTHAGPSRSSRACNHRSERYFLFGHDQVSAPVCTLVLVVLVKHAERQ